MILWHSLSLISLSAVGYGLWLIHPPTAYIVIGAIIFATAEMRVYRSSNRDSG